MSRNAGKLKVEYEVIVKDKDGKVLQREKRTSKSLLLNFIHWLRSKFTISAETTYASAWTATDIGGVGRTFPYSTSQAESKWGYFGGANTITTVGIVIGKGLTAVVPTDTKLVDQILHGSGADQMNYGVQTVEAAEVVNTTSRFRTVRPFTNSSGDSITVKEIGCYLAQLDSGNIIRYLCFLRDVLVTPSTVPDGASLTVRYRLGVTA